MRTLILILLVSVKLNAQVLCGTANENGSVTLTAPAGNTFTLIEFASYGTPNGSCGAFTFGSCHSASSGTVVSSALLGQNSATIAATNGIFGDPCVGTVKRLYIQAVYSATVPLTLIYFTAKKAGQGKVMLEWKSENEINTSHFIVERSTDGSTFEPIGSIPAVLTGGSVYSFTNMISVYVPLYHYRLKMVDRDEKFEYSQIVRISNLNADIDISAYPNPASGQLTIFTNKKQEAIISDIRGRVVKKWITNSGTQNINIAHLLPGLYFIRTEKTVIRLIKK